MSQKMHHSAADAKGPGANYPRFEDTENVSRNAKGPGDYYPRFEDTEQVSRNAKGPGANYPRSEDTEQVSKKAKEPDACDSRPSGPARLQLVQVQEDAPAELHHHRGEDPQLHHQGLRTTSCGGWTRYAESAKESDIGLAKSASAAKGT
jgi:hypothetical protein